MEKDSKMFLKRSAYHVSKARDLDSALQKSKGVEEALNRLKNIQADYQREALLVANKTMAKNYGFYSLKKFVKFMSEMAELPDSKKVKILNTVNPRILQNKPQSSDKDESQDNGSNTTENSHDNGATPVPPVDSNKE